MPRRYGQFFLAKRSSRLVRIGPSSGLAPSSALTPPPSDGRLTKHRWSRSSCASLTIDSRCSVRSGGAGWAFAWMTFASAAGAIRQLPPSHTAPGRQSWTLWLMFVVVSTRSSRRTMSSRGRRSSSRGCGSCSSSIDIPGEGAARRLRPGCWTSCLRSGKAKRDYGAALSASTRDEPSVPSGVGEAWCRWRLRPESSCFPATFICS